MFGNWLGPVKRSNDVVLSFGTDTLSGRCSRMPKRPWSKCPSTVEIVSLDYLSVSQIRVMQKINSHHVRRLKVQRHDKNSDAIPRKFTRDVNKVS